MKQINENWNCNKMLTSFPYFASITVTIPSRKMSLPSSLSNQNIDAIGPLEKQIYYVFCKIIIGLKSSSCSVSQQLLQKSRQLGAKRRGVT